MREIKSLYGIIKVCCIGAMSAIMRLVTKNHLPTTGVTGAVGMLKERLVDTAEDPLSNESRASRGCFVTTDVTHCGAQKTLLGIRRQHIKTGDVVRGCSCEGRSATRSGGERFSQEITTLAKYVGTAVAGIWRQTTLGRLPCIQSFVLMSQTDEQFVGNATS